jgi:hypothetical protein
MLTLKLVCLLHRFLVQQFYRIGMIYTFIRVHHKVSIMLQQVVLKIVLLHLSFIRVISINHHNSIIMKCSSSKVRPVLFNIDILMQVMEVLVVLLVYKVVNWKNAFAFSLNVLLVFLASSSGPYIQYSYDLANSVHSNMSLTFDTNLGIYTNSTF